MRNYFTGSRVGLPIVVLGGGVLLACGEDQGPSQERAIARQRQGVAILLPAVQAVPATNAKRPVVSAAGVSSGVAIKSDACQCAPQGNVVVYGDFLLNGELFPASDYEDALIYLESETGQLILLANTHDQHFEVEIPPGRYTVVYDHQSGGWLAPRNHMARIGEAVKVQQSGRLDIQVEATNIIGQVTHNGQPFPDSIYDKGKIYYSRFGETVGILMHTTDLDFDARLIPGSYDFYYGVDLSNGLAPCNHKRHIYSATVPASGALNIDVLSRSIQFEKMLNGEAFPGTQYHEADLSVLDVTTGDLIRLGDTNKDWPLIPLVVGDYQIVYTHTKGYQIPQNRGARLGELSVLPAPGGAAVAPFHHNIEVVAVQTQGGFSSPAAAPGSATLLDHYWLVPESMGSIVLLGSGSSYSTLLLPDTYQVVHSFHSAADEALTAHTVVEPTWEVSGTSMTTDFSAPSGGVAFAPPGP